ncbi:MAG: diacylglycerol kinase family lipid kinase [Cyclobacteriaceae bacterium]|nr:diacylglycerol kinase family lipid kinase [Cyclobacteriaceae bacterium]
MKIFVILNGVSRKKEKFYRDILPPLQTKFDCSVAETRYSGHAIQLAREATHQNFECIISCGGDGTLNQVLNGMLSDGFENLPKLAILPLGSGNDFAGSCSLQLERQQLISLLEKNNPIATDVGKIICNDLSGTPIKKYFLNVASVGMGPATVERMEKLPRWMGSDLRYLAAILHTFFTHRPTHLSIKTESWNWAGKARVWAMANGQSFGNRIYIAPQSTPNDGIFDTFLASDVPLLKFLIYLQQLKGKKNINDSKIQYNQGRYFEMTASQNLAIEADGEIQGYLPAKVELLSNRILIFRQ